MRTLKFTHDEVVTILKALAIAEKVTGEVRNNFFEKLVNIRGGNPSEHITDPMFIMENEFTDLFLEIRNSNKDV
jgi:hypothetical protein